ncbi:MAG: tryptophan synthase subunit alpha [Candidatus Wallbacteria bacterium]|nr:tryptophan synthase subunit alpha [Candidatus Wallbacteria bacterium]
MIISNLFKNLRKNGSKAFIPYFTAGFPTLEKSLEIVGTAEANGADLIEIGYPFSDPVADGKTIQFSSQIALEQGITLKSMLERFAESRFTVPLILMSYINPLMSYGDGLMSDLAASGFSGLVVPDLPLEEASAWSKRANSCGIDLVLLVTPTSGPERIRKIAALARGFIYCVSLTGTTGSRSSLAPDTAGFLASVREITTKPLCLGFGISTPEQAAQAAVFADGVIVGSRLVEAIRAGEDVAGLVKEFRTAVN